SGLELIVTGRRIIQFGKNLPTPVIACRDVSRLDTSDPVEKQILDFLEGGTDGEDLLHALYDHVLDEPVPERMRALFRKGSAD
ncbi:MAG TPA: hypothetical protein VKF83_04965, partial [Stellaceae bacterium]|nr:hypothetical protein [Stellaceae bacterium]